MWFLQGNTARFLPSEALLCSLQSQIQKCQNKSVMVTYCYCSDFHQTSSAESCVSEYSSEVFVLHLWGSFMEESLVVCPDFEQMQALCTVCPIAWAQWPWSVSFSADFTPSLPMHLPRRSLLCWPELSWGVEPPMESAVHPSSSEWVHLCEVIGTCFAAGRGSSPAVPRSEPFTGTGTSGELPGLVFQGSDHSWQQETFSLWPQGWQELIFPGVGLWMGFLYERIQLCWETTWGSFHCVNAKSVLTCSP